MNEEAWPTPSEPSRAPLPRVEDLPVADQGYEQESVRAAFDSFYRHAAQLDAALRTLEAVESFHRHAGALRADLRALRSAGWTQQSWDVTPAYGYARRSPREGVSPVVWRIAGETAFLIAVAVVVGVAKLDWWLILIVIGIAFAIVLLFEWSMARERYVGHRTVAMPPPVVEGEAVAEPPAEETDSRGWAAFEEAQEPSDAMTMVAAPPAAEAEPVATPDPEPAATTEPEEPELAGEPDPEPDPEPIAEPEPEPEELTPAAAAEPVAEVGREPEADQEPDSEQPRRRWWGRREVGQAEEPEAPIAPEPPRHVRVLAAPENDGERDLAVDPWDSVFEEPVVDDTGDGPDEDADEREPAVAGESDQPGRRRFRRR